VRRRHANGSVGETIAIHIAARHRKDRQLAQRQVDVCQ
jgi:hypothetical protein